MSSIRKPACEKSMQWCIQGLLWAHRFLRNKNGKAAGGLGFGGKAPGKYFIFTSRKSLKHA